MEQFEDCYVELTMVLKTVEMLDGGGRIVFSSNVTKKAILHIAQANNPGKLNTIKQKMWEDLLREKQWKPVFQTNTSKYIRMCDFKLKKIPRMSAPISYNI